MRWLGSVKVILLSVVVLALSWLLVLPASAAAPPIPVPDGSSPDRAAMSCWEIKQSTPASPNGAYWLVTPTLQQPQQFYCDMTYNGGGWVLVGKGREGWQEQYIGQGSPSALLNPDRTPSGFATVQLDARTVDGLMNGSRVDALADGIRLYRARSADGTQWQNVNFNMTGRDRWVWSMGALHPVGTSTFDGSAAGTGGQTANFGRDNTWNRVTFSYNAAQLWRAGFSYGPSATGGSNSASTFLWSAASNGSSPRPYTEMYIRPQLTSSNTTFAPVQDTGTTEQAQLAVASSFAAPGSWGVTGSFNGRTAEGNSEVQDFAQIGSVVYVAGNFQYVQRGASASGDNKVLQPVLAAFDSDTGNFIRTFTPKFNNQVKSILALPNGNLLAAGDFTQVNGRPALGTVLLNASSGDTDASWNVQMENRISTGVLTVRSLSLSGDYVYMGGGFTHLTGGTEKAWVYSRNAARIAWATATPDRNWNPNFDGTLVSTDVSPDGDRLYAAGYFTTSNGAYANKAAAVLSATGAPLASPKWTTVWSNSDRSGYQQAIRAVGNRVYVGGSEHSIFGYDPSTFTRVSGSTTQGTGGDFQALDTSGTVVYGGCHCGSWAYENSFNWPTPTAGWTQADKIQWIGAWDAVTGKYIPSFSPPALASRNGAGVWAIFVDKQGTVWSGGDLSGARTSPTASQWAGGFVRFPLNDHAAPTKPGNARVVQSDENSVSLAWSNSVDTGGAVQYEVLRGDRVVAVTSTLSAVVPRAGDDRFFVRSVDREKNRSASSAVLRPDLPPPPSDQDPDPIAMGSEWSFRSSLEAPPVNWNAQSYDAGSWAAGRAPIGFGTSSIATNIDATPASSRSIVDYVRRDLIIKDVSQLDTLTLTTIADDGQIVYVNGVEVSRTRVSPGAPTNTTYANAAVSTASATANPISISVPKALLVNGTNVIAASVHLNYRSTPNISFDLSAKASYLSP